MAATAMAPAAPESRQTQMNTRIDAGLKEAGDAVLAGLGYTPSVAVRGLWRFVVEHQDDAASIRAVLDPEPCGASGADRRLALLESTRDRYVGTLAALGLGSDGPAADGATWDELRDAWYDERLGEGA